MGKIKVNEIEKHDATEVTVNSNVVMAAGTSVSSPSISTDTISEKTSASGVTIDGVLVKDGAIASSYISGLTDNVGLSSAQQFRLTASISSTGTNDITTNLEVPDTENQGNLGTLVSHSSGIFSFSETGYYAVVVNQRGSGGSGGYVYVGTLLTDDNLTYTEAARAQWEGSGLGLAASSIAIIDVTNTSNDKVKFTSNIQTSGANITGSTTINFTTFTFLKLGDT